MRPWALLLLGLPAWAQGTPAPRAFELTPDTALHGAAVGPSYVFLAPALADIDAVLKGQHEALAACQGERVALREETARVVDARKAPPWRGYLLAALVGAVAGGGAALYLAR